MLTFYLILLLSASNDVIAWMFQISVLAMTVGFRIALFVIPLVVSFVVYKWFKAVKITGAEGYRSKPLPGHPPHPRGAIVSIHVFQESDGRWRWEYLDDKVGLEQQDLW